MHRFNKPVNILITLIIIALLILFTYILFQRKFHPPGSLDEFMYASIIGTAIFAFILHKCGDELKSRVLLLTFSIIMSVYASELLLEIYNSSRAKPGWMLRMEAAKKLDIPFDMRTQYETLMDLKKKDKNIHLAITPHTLIRTEGYFDEEAAVYPFGSISNKTLLACNEHGKWLTYKSDKYGFRNPEGVYDNGDIDIVLAGDSFTQGICVDDGEDIAGWLRKSGFNVYNLGAGSNGPLIELGTIKEYAEPVKPKVVLMFYYAGNDLDGLKKERLSPVLMNYLDNEFSQTLLNKQHLIDNALIKFLEEELYDFKKKQYHTEKTTSVSLSKVIKLHNLRYKLGIKDECVFYMDPIEKVAQNPDAEPLFKKILIRADSMVKKWGGQFMFVYLPSTARYAASKHDLCQYRYYTESKKAVSNLVKGLGIPFIDIEQSVSNHEDINSLFPFAGGHYNSKGYKLIADEVTNFIKSGDYLNTSQQ